MVEIAARGGGVYLSSHLTPRASGVNSNVLLIDYLTENKIDLTIGMKIGELKDDTCKLGPILFLGNNREECYDAIQKVKDTLCIETTDENNNISGIIW